MPRKVESVAVSPEAMALRKAEIDVLLRMLMASFGTDAADADEQQEHLAFLEGDETEQLLRPVLSHDVMIRE
jgi:hypothetical protein